MADDAHSQQPAISRASLRFAALCDAPLLEDWQARCVEALAALPGASLVSLVIDSAARPRRALPLLPTPASLRRRPLAPALADVPRLSPDDVGSPRLSAVELLLRFHFDALSAPLLALPALGVWSFAHDDEARAADAPPGYWTLRDAAPTCTIGLWRLTAPDAGSPLRVGEVRSVRSSWTLHVDRVYGEAARWPAELGRTWQAGAELSSAGERRRADRRRPSQLALRALTPRLAARRLSRALRRHTRREEWGVGLLRRPVAGLLEEGALRDIEWLQLEPAASFRADPFGVRTESGALILFEEWDDALGRGRIAATSLDAAGSPCAVAPALHATHHLSYPYLVESGGDLYCVPESAEAREVVLYRAEDPPRRWARVATLLEGLAVADATPFPHAGRWWMWCSDAEGDAATRLRLFCAEVLAGPWREHPRSPVKVDVRSARPAGTPFVHEGALYRPAQDCGRGYGGAVVIHRVECLTATEYEERPVARIEPDRAGPYPAGLHTVASFGDWTLVDGKRYRPAWSGLLARALGLRVLRLRPGEMQR